jgi:hypothetical protein
MPRAVIKVARDGSVSIEGHGFEGDTCKGPLEKLARAAGDIVESRQKREVECVTESEAEKQLA